MRICRNYKSNGYHERCNGNSECLSDIPASRNYLCPEAVILSQEDGNFSVIDLVRSNPTVSEVRTRRLQRSP